MAIQTLLSPVQKPRPDRQKKGMSKAKNESTRDTTDTTYRWSNEEHLLFILNFHTFKRQWKQISDHQQGRDATKCRTHGQKYLLSLQSIKQEVEKILQGKAPTSDFLVKLMKYETERRQLLKVHSLGIEDVNGRKLEAAFMPKYLLDEATSI